MHLRHFFKISFLFSLVFLWVYAAWPQIQLPTGDFPPDIEEALAADIIFGLPFSVDDGSSEEIVMSLAEISDKKFVVCYREATGAGGDGYCRVGDAVGVSPNERDIVWGAPYRFSSGSFDVENGEWDITATCKIGANKFAVTFVELGRYTVIGEISGGNVITYGLINEYDPTASSLFGPWTGCAGVDETDERWIIAEWGTSDTKTVLYACESTGATGRNVTCGLPVEPDPPNGWEGEWHTVSKLGLNKFMVAFTSNQSGDPGWAYVGDVNTGDNSLNIGSRTAFTTEVGRGEGHETGGSPEFTSSCSPDDPDRFVLAFYKNGAFGEDVGVEVVAGTASGNAISELGNPLDFYDGPVKHTKCTFTDDTHFVVVYEDDNTNGNGISRYCTVNWGPGLDITCNAPETFHTDSVLPAYGNGLGLATISGYGPPFPDKIVISYVDDFDRRNGYAIIADVGGVPVDNFPPGKVTDLIAPLVTGTAVDLRWTAPDEDGPPGPLSGGAVASYDVRYATEPITDGPGGNWDTVTTMATGEPAFPLAPPGTENMMGAITGLIPETNYWFAIKSTDFAGNISPLSVPDLMIRTLDITDPTVVNLMAPSATAGTVDLTWDAPYEDWNDTTSGAVDFYEIKQSTVGAITELNWDDTIRNQPVAGTIPSPPAVPPTGEMMLVTGLTPSTTYWFGLRAVDFAGNDSYSTSPTIMTDVADPDPPAQITNLVADTPTETTVRLTWDSPDEDGSPGSGQPTVSYQVRQSDVEINDVNWEVATPVLGVIPSPPAPVGTGEVMTVLGLEPGKTYFFAVVSTDGGGNDSPVSNSPMLSTSPITSCGAGPLLEEVVKGNDGGDNDQIVLPTIGSPGGDSRQLYVLMVASRNNEDVTSVIDNLGILDWGTALLDQCSGRDNAGSAHQGVDIWTAFGDTTGPLTVTVNFAGGGTTEHSAILARYSGADFKGPFEDPTSENTKEEGDITCSDGVDNDSPHLELSSTRPNSVFVFATNPRNTLIGTPDPTYTEHGFEVDGAGGDRTGLYFHDQCIASENTIYGATHTLLNNNPKDWVTAGLVINPPLISGGITTIASTSPDHWAWNDVIGWIDFCGEDPGEITGCNLPIEVPLLTGPLTGYASSSIGFIDLDCDTSVNPPPDCGDPKYDDWGVVRRDINGASWLEGWAWNNTIGWISFGCDIDHTSDGNPALQDCSGPDGSAPSNGPLDYGVFIDAFGNFRGWAWNEIIGWISFNCDHTSDPWGGGSTCLTHNYRVKTKESLGLIVGEIESSILDTEVVTGAQINSIMWDGVTNGGVVEMSIAVSNNPALPWNYTPYLPIGPLTPVILNSLSYRDYRYIRYRLRLSKSDSGSPVVQDVIINWAP